MYKWPFITRTNPENPTSLIALNFFFKTIQRSSSDSRHFPWFGFVLLFSSLSLLLLSCFCPTLFYAAGCKDLDKTQDDLLKHQASISELKRNFMESTPEPRPNEWEKRRITPLSLQTQGVCHHFFFFSMLLSWLNLKRAVWKTIFLQVSSWIQVARKLPE